MQILWLCNIILPDVIRELGKEPTPIGGWISGMLDVILTHGDGIKLSICMPCTWISKVTTGKTSRYCYYLFPLCKRDVESYNDKIEVSFESILNKEQPDVVHIWGTEFPHTLAMVNACETVGILDKVVINIQGLVSIIAQHYYSSLPWGVVYDFFTPRYIVFHDCIVRQKKAFEKRGKYEIEALRKVKHVIGRTDWDRACVTQINPNVNYHFCNEILRKTFYHHEWDLDKCEKYSIFVSQATYPIKGLHFVLEALPLIIRQYPQTHLYVAGPDVTCSNGGIKGQLKLTAYGKYIKKLIKKYNLHNYVTFCGVLDEEQMCERYLCSHVFVSASSIENSPNSVCEAMILGMPVVSSDVGGVKNLLEHGKEGFIYQHDAPYMLTFYITQIFDNTNYAIEICKMARNKMLRISDPQNNLKRNLEIYQLICYDPNNK